MAFFLFFFLPAQIGPGNSMPRLAKALPFRKEAFTLDSFNESEIKDKLAVYDRLSAHLKPEDVANLMKKKDIRQL